MVGHDDMVLHFDHRIVSCDTGCQFPFNHAANSRQFHLWRIRMTIRFVGFTNHHTQRLMKRFTYLYGNMICSRPAIVVYVAPPNMLIIRR